MLPSESPFAHNYPAGYARFRATLEPSLALEVRNALGLTPNAAFFDQDRALVSVCLRQAYRSAVHANSGLFSFACALSLQALKIARYKKLSVVLTPRP